MLPLEGVLVVSLEQAVAAPLCSCRLADAGARVIKVERAEGDFARGFDRAAKGQSSYFVWLNRGKESIVLDIKKAEDSALLTRIIERADVYIVNLAAGAAERAGLGVAAMRARNPRLIACSISGYGEEGPYRARKAYDLLIQAEAGLASITGAPEGPGRVGVSIVDIGTGLNAHAAILQALYTRERTGEGAAISISLFDSTAELMAVPLVQTEGGMPPQRVGLRHPSIAPYGVFRTGGGGQVLLSIQNEREWRTLCAAVLGRPELATDPRFADNPARVRNRDALEAIMEAVFAPLTRDEVAARLDAADIAYGILGAPEDLARHPHLRRVAIPTETGPVEVPAPPARRAGIEPHIGRVPRIGEHTQAIRKEFAA